MARTNKGYSADTTLIIRNMNPEDKYLLVKMAKHKGRPIAKVVKEILSREVRKYFQSRG
jgi:hypothetical protein